MRFLTNRRTVKPINMVKFTSIIAFIFISIIANAQAPGYMGKKVSIGIDVPMIVTGFDIFGLTDGDYYYVKPNPSGGTSYANHEYSTIVFKYKPTLFLDFVLSRRTSIQVIARYFTSKVDVHSYYIDTLGSTVTYDPSDRSKTRSIAFGLRYKLFYGYGISPIGKYFSFGLEYASTKFLVDETPFYSNQGEIGYPKNTTSFAVIPTFGMGIQQPISGSLLFNFGFEAGIPINPKNKGLSYTYSNDWANQNSAKNIRQSYLINVNIGISLVL